MSWLLNNRYLTTIGTSKPGKQKASFASLEGIFPALSDTIATNVTPDSCTVRQDCQRLVMNV